MGKSTTANRNWKSAHVISNQLRRAFGPREVDCLRPLFLIFVLHRLKVSVTFYVVSQMRCDTKVKRAVLPLKETQSKKYKNFTSMRDLKWYYDENRIFPTYLSHFETSTSSLLEKKNAVYIFQISLFVPEIFKFLKYAN